jgi:hypothetical protein
MSSAALMSHQHLVGLTLPSAGRDPRLTKFIGDVVVEFNYAPLPEVEKAIAASRATGRRTARSSSRTARSRLTSSRA